LRPAFLLRSHGPTRCTAGVFDRGGVQKQTQTSGGQNTFSGWWCSGGSSKADPNFRGSKRSVEGPVPKSGRSKADPNFRGSKPRGGANRSASRRSKADPNFRGSKLPSRPQPRPRAVQKQTQTSGGQNPSMRGGSSMLISSKADPNFRGSKLFSRVSERRAAFKSRPKLQGVKTLGEVAMSPHAVSLAKHAAAGPRALRWRCNRSGAQFSGTPRCGRKFS
jgi:hypothetical protein